MSEKKRVPRRAVRQPMDVTASDGAKKTNKQKDDPIKKGRTAKRVLLVILLAVAAIVVILAAVAAGFFFHYSSLLDYDDGQDTWETGVTLPEESEEETFPTVDSERVADESEIGEYLKKLREINDSGTGYVTEYDKLSGKLGEVERDYNAEYISASDNVINLLLIGVDAYGTSTVGRSDVMVVLSICPEEKKIVMTSFLRDILVSIPDYGENRLNAAYAFGGPSLLIRVLETNFGLRIDRYAMVNFTTFVKAIEVIGSLRIYLTEAELSVINNHLTVALSAERQKLSLDTSGGAGYYDLLPAQALAYARIRKIDSDFGRTNRQRTVLAAAFNKLKTMSPSSFDSMLNAILPNIRTSLTRTDLLTLLLNAAEYSGYSLESYNIPQNDEFKYMTVSGRSVLGVDMEASKKHLAEWVYGK